LCSHSAVFQHFMETEGSLPSSQELSTCTYPEPDQPSPQHSILSLKSLILMISIHLRLGRPSGLFPSGLPTNNLYTFLFSPIRTTCHMPRYKNLKSIIWYIRTCNQLQVIWRFGGIFCVHLSSCFLARLLLLTSRSWLLNSAKR
jgi:hypothetical protein